jgi:hypothetical protein
MLSLVGKMRGIESGGEAEYTEMGKRTKMRRSRVIRRKRLKSNMRRQMHFVFEHSIYTVANNTLSVIEYAYVICTTAVNQIFSPPIHLLKKLSLH